jgi:hypothetical protein
MRSVWTIVLDISGPPLTLSTYLGGNPTVWQWGLTLLKTAILAPL